MPNYLDHLDLIDPNNRVVVAMLQDRETLALATDNLSKINNLDTKIDNVNDALSTMISNNIVYVPSNELNLDNTGVNDCSAILSSLANNVGLKAGVYKIAQSITISKQIVFAEGAILNIPSGVTVTINGNILAGRYKIFDGNGAVNGNNNLTSVAYPEWFGAKVNDNTVDNAIYINKALNSFKKVILGVGIYYCSNTISLNSNNSLVGSFENKYTQSGKGTIIDSSALNVINIIKEPYTTVNENITGSIIKDFTISMPFDNNERIGVVMLNALFCIAENITVLNGYNGFAISGCVHCHFIRCTAFKDTSLSTSLVEYVGFKCNPSNSDLAGDNASIYFDECSASGAISLNQMNSYGFASRGRNADLFFNNCETVGFTAGFEIQFPTNNLGQNNNIHFNGCIADAATFAAFHIVGLSEQSDCGVIFTDCWGAMINGSTGNSYHFDNIDGIYVDNCIAFPNSANAGFYLTNVRRFAIKNSPVANATYGIDMKYCSNGIVEANCKAVTHPIRALDNYLTNFYCHSLLGTDVNINGTITSSSSTDNDMNDVVVGTNKLIAPYAI